MPIVFGVAQDPRASGGNATGVNFFFGELTAKRLGLLHELVPKAARIAVLVNPADPQTAETTVRYSGLERRGRACRRWV
jgi:hypothetical protein